jgi:hypothetical protein
VSRGLTPALHRAHNPGLQTAAETKRPLVRVQSRRTVNPLFNQENNSTLTGKGGHSAKPLMMSKRKESDGSSIYERPPRPPPRPSLRFKKNGQRAPLSPRKGADQTQTQAQAHVQAQVPAPEVAEIFDEVALCSTEQLSSTRAPVPADEPVPRNRSRQPTGRWQREKKAEMERMQREEREVRVMDPRVMSPLRAKSVRLASRPLPQAPGVSSTAGRIAQKKSMKRAANKSVRNRARSVKHRSGGVQQQLSDNAKRQQEQEESATRGSDATDEAHRRQSAPGAPSHGHAAAAPSPDASRATDSADPPTQARRSNPRVTRLEAMSSSTDAEDLAQQRLAAASSRRNRRRNPNTADPTVAAAPTKTKGKTKGKGFDRDKHRSIRLETSGTSVCDESNSTTSRRGAVTRQGTGRWAGGPKPSDSAKSATSSGPELEDETQGKAPCKRRGTGRWNGERPEAPAAPVVASPPSQPDDVDRALTISRKRQSTGRWNAEQRRAPAGTARPPSNGEGSVAQAEVLNNRKAVLAESIKLADVAWQDLADYRECSINDVAHESQLVTDEGTETRLPSWRIDQIKGKKEEAASVLTRRQRRRNNKRERKLAAQKRQIEKLIASYFPSKEC